MLHVIAAVLSSPQSGLPVRKGVLNQHGKKPNYMKIQIASYIYFLLLFLCSLG